MNGLRAGVGFAWAVVCAAAIGAAASGGCSVLLDTSAEQCHNNNDCTRFPNAVCNLANHLCVMRVASTQPDAHVDPDGSTQTGPGLAACHDETGCIPCPAAATPSFLDACTNAKCITFDNKARLLNMDPDGGLRQLP
jgi:hypothetical protein